MTICHLSFALAIFNLLLILYVVRRAEQRRGETEATDQLLRTIVKGQAERRAPRFGQD